MRLVPLYCFIGSALPSGDVRLVYDLAAEHLRGKRVGQHEQADDYACIKEYLLFHNNSTSFCVNTLRSYFDISL